MLKTMKKYPTAVLEKLNEIERDIQTLKFEYLTSALESKKSRFEIYKEGDILKEVRKVRKQLWHEKHPKSS